MRKFLSCILVVSFLFTGIFPVSAITVRTSGASSMSDSQDTPSEISYPSGEDFASLKSLIDTTFSPQQGYQYNCIANSTLCPNYKYTSVVEKAIKLIVLKTYAGNENFYRTLFPISSSYYEEENIDELLKSSYPELKTVLARVPTGTTLSDWKTFGFGRSIGGQLLDASFGVDFSENTSSNGMLGAIEQKIKDIKRNNCQKSQGTNCYSSNLSNIYLPTVAELDAETIYLNGSSVKISSLKNEFEYILSGVVASPSVQLVSQYPQRNELDTLFQELSASGYVFPYQVTVVSVRKNPTMIGTQSATSTLKSYRSQVMNRGISSVSTGSTWVPDLESELSFVDGLITEMEYYDTELQNRGSNISYTLRYKKDSYTLEEAKAEIEKKNQGTVGTNNLVATETDFHKVPCNISTLSPLQGYTDGSICIAATANLKDIQTTLGAYYADTETYPDSIDKLDSSYLPEQETLTKFKENFTYTNTTQNQIPTFEIRYIGHIGEDSSSTGTTMRRDYVALLSGATVPEIPSLFAHVPSDSMVLYVRNPANLLDILNQKSNTSTRLSGIDVSESIRKFMTTFFELENFDQIQSHLKNEMAIVVNNLDATAPDIVVILSEADKDALSPTAKARVVGSKDGFIFIASSKETLERFTNLTAPKSMKESPDFHYVWWKKSQKIKDAFMFVGDEFFEKMLTFETYLAHYRKYRDYARLWSLQELVWAYSDAFSQSPTSLDELTQLGFSSLTGATLAEYSIQDGIVVHKNIGSLKSLSTLPESNYDFSQISRAEIEDYKTNVLKYRDIWRASLDPMGIVLNRYGDGMEVDFFMTPIPLIDDGNMQLAQKFFSEITKDSLSFITNPRIRTGIASFVFGFDVKKVQQGIESQKEFQSGFDEFSQEVLDGKNIFDYIGGEFAFSFGGLDPDILDGWNVEKVDIYGSVQVISEEKGKELIDMIRTKILAQFDRSSSSEAELIKGFLAKPLIEDYNTRKIYYVEGLPIPFVGKIGFAYTFIDDFFIIGLNRSTIKKVIDVANSGDARKKELIDAGSFSTGTVFATIFDGVKSSEQFKALYEKNKTSIPRYVRYLKMSDLSNDSSFRTLLSSYYVTQDRNRRLSLSAKPFSYTLGALSLDGDTDNISVQLDEKKLAALTGTTLQTWENLKSESDFPKDILTESGIILSNLLEYKNVGDIASFALVSHLDAAFDGSESLFRNTTFGLNIGDNEIGFDLRIFRNKDSSGSNGIPISQEMMLILISVGVLILIGGAVGFLIFQKRKNIGGTPPTVPMNPIPSGESLISPIVTPPTPTIITDSIPSVVPVATATITSGEIQVVVPETPVVPEIPVVPEVSIVPETNTSDSSENQQ